MHQISARLTTVDSKSLGWATTQLHGMKLLLLPSIFACSQHSTMKRCILLQDHLETPLPQLVVCQTCTQHFDVHACQHASIADWSLRLSADCNSQRRKSAHACGGSSVDTVHSCDGPMHGAQLHGRLQHWALLSCSAAVAAVSLEHDKTAGSCEWCTDAHSG